MANSVESITDWQTASHLDLHCLQMVWYIRLKTENTGLTTVTETTDRSLTSGFVGYQDYIALAIFDWDVS